MNAIGTWSKTYVLQLVVLVAVVVVMYSLHPQFHVESSIARIIPMGLIAAGLAVTLIAGEFDLSIASMAAFAGALTVSLARIGLIPALLIAIVVSVGLGVLQGWAIAKLKINSLVFTVGTLILIRGLAWFLAGGVNQSIEDFTATDIFRGKIGFLSPLSIVGLLIFIALGIFLARTRWGKELYALGGARSEAVAAGVPYKRGMMVSFGLSGGLGGAGGAMQTALGGSIAPNAFEGMLLLGLAAVLIGGISLAGGRGNMMNVFLGFAIVAILSAGLAAMGTKAFVAELYIGALLLAVVLFDHLINRLSISKQFKRLRREVLSEA